MSAIMPSMSPLVGRESFERDYHPLKWKTVMSWEKDGILQVIRIGRNRFLRRQDIEDLILDGGKQFPGGWRRRPLEG